MLNHNFLNPGRNAVHHMACSDSDNALDWQHVWNYDIANDLKAPFRRCPDNFPNPFSGSRKSIWETAPEKNKGVKPGSIIMELPVTRRIAIENTVPRVQNKNPIVAALGEKGSSAATSNL